MRNKIIFTILLIISLGVVLNIYNVKAVTKTRILYQTHVQDYGWQGTVSNGATAGTSGKSLRLEGIKISLENKEYNGDIEYRTHVQDYGWMEYKSNGAMSGTSHESKRLEAIQIRLTGELANHYDVYYRVHAQNFGWMGWAKNDEMSGSAHYSYRLEAIEIVLVEKGQNPPTRTDTRTEEPFIDKNAVSSITLNKTNLEIEVGDTETLLATINPDTAVNKALAWISDNTSSVTVDKNGKLTAVAEGTAKITVISNNGKKAECNVNVLPATPGVKYKTHVQDYGWQDYVSNGTMSGTSHESKRLEGIKIELRNMPYEGGIEYRTHVQDYGWMDYTSNGGMSGTSHESKRLEAIQIRLTGELANHYDVYYRVHAENLGWMGWAKNDEMSGSAHYSYRLEAIEIVVVEKGQNPPTRTDTRTKAPFVEKNAITNIELDLSDKIYIMNVGNSYKLTTTITPTDATNNTLTWTSSNENVATVEKGKITAHKQGIATITAKSSNGVKGKCTIAVLLPSETKDDIQLTANEAKENTKMLNKAIELASTTVHNIKFQSNRYFHFFISDNDTYPSNNIEIPYHINLKSNVNLELNNSKIVMYPYDAHGDSIKEYRYYIMDMTDVSNVTLTNGRIIGDREYHNYDTNYGNGLDTHQWGMGINIKDSQNIVIDNMQIYSTTGDGIVIKDSMSYDENTCEEKNITSDITIMNSKIHDVRRDGISVIAGSNININANKIYNIGKQYNHKDGTTKDGTPPRAGINLERNISETCGYTLLDENDNPVLNSHGEPKKRQQIEEFIRNVTIMNNELYNNGNDQDIIYLNGVYNLKVAVNKLEKRIGINSTYNCDAPPGGTYTGVDRCYQGDNINVYTQDIFKNQYGFVIRNNIDRTGLHQDTINTMYIIRDPNSADNICCKSFRSNNKCQQPKYNPYNLCKKQ